MGLFFPRHLFLMFALLALELLCLAHQLLFLLPRLALLFMIIGMVPMATGYSQNAPLGRAVIGGLLVATFFTLFFVPCVYAMIYSRRTAVREDKSDTGVVVPLPVGEHKQAA